ncbi:amino acid permease [Cutibacterium sp. WCA-380-WT-3A]|uniref:Amino acid permease n=1 Tax=Cutibacterium porci TaxID=2605781 RepID=A0A7K0J3U4_9ACTN|nr:amino acid permease [Cutibacterium porci]MSS44589.1 amino acid permease [Cutibacterium porci]
MNGFNNIPDGRGHPHAPTPAFHDDITAYAVESQPHHPAKAHLHRNLSNRHIQLIAIGGAIGTGLFLGSGKAIRAAGPSIVVSYLIIGTMLYFVVRAMGELLMYNLDYKSFQDFAADLIGPWAGFFLGWTYWLCWIVTGMAEIIGITTYWDFWVKNKGLATFLAAATLLLLLCLNLLTVRMFGELEFWFAFIKIIAIISLILLALVLAVMKFHSPTGGAASISNLWNRGGFMPNGWSGFFAGFQMAAFAFVGIELIGTTAAETQDPEKTLPKAISAVPARILIFYIGALLAIMTVVPWNEVRADSSPFVQVLGIVGFAGAASVMNFVVLTSAASSSNSGIYSISRMLFGLAHKRMAPQLFGRLSAHGVPRCGLVVTVLVLSTALPLAASASFVEAFTLVTTISSVLFIFVWSMIVISYMKYRKVAPSAHAASKYPMPGGRGMCWAVLAFFALVLVLLAQEADTARALSLTPIWFAILGIGWFFDRRHAICDDVGTDDAHSKGDS